MADPKLQIVIEAKDNTGKVFKNVDSRVSNISSNLKKMAIAATAVATAVGFIGKKFLDAAADFEQTQIAFTTMLGSAEKAKILLEDLAQFAARTPFELKEIELSAKQLLAYGTAAGDITSTLQVLGDIASTVGTDKMPNLIRAFGQIQAKGRLMGQELLQLTETGIPILPELAKITGKSTQEISANVGTMGISFDIVRQAMTNMASEGGIAFSAMEAQSKTFNGAVSNLKDQINLFIREAGFPLIEMGKGIVFSMTGVVEAVREAGGIFEYFNQIIQGVLVYIENNTGLITLFKSAFDSVAIVFKENLLPALQRFWVAITPLKPFLVAFAQVVGVVLLGALIALVKFMEMAVITTINILSGALNVASAAIDFFISLWDGVVSVLAKVISTIDILIAKIKSLNILQGAKSFIGGVFGGARASGGPVSSAKTYMVGENGPEMFSPSKSGNIIPNHKLQGGGSTIIVNVAGNVSTEKDLAQSIGEILTKNMMFNQAIVG